MGPEAIKHLKKYTDKAKVKNPKEVLKIINCELYSILKVKYLIFYYIGNKKPTIKLFK